MGCVELRWMFCGGAVEKRQRGRASSSGGVVVEWDGAGNVRGCGGIRYCAISMLVARTPKTHQHYANSLRAAISSQEHTMTIGVAIVGSGTEYSPQTPPPLRTASMLID
jgi:hypothetical protein